MDKDCWRRMLGVVLCGILAISGCAPAPTPTSLPAPTPTAAPTFTRTPTALPATTLDAPYLTQAAAGIAVAIRQGTADINNVASSCTPDRFGFGYIAQGWRQQAALDDLARDPVLTVKFLVSLGAFRETDGIFYPALQEQKVIFPALDGLALPRITLKQVPAVADQTALAVAPRGLVIRPGAEMTVIGLLAAPTGQSAAPPRALVAFSDPQRAGWLAVRHFMALLPLQSPVDESGGLSLAGLLALNQGRLDAANGVLLLPQASGEVAVQLNRIAGDALAAALDDATGIAFVDHLDGKLLDEPVIPYPPGLDLPAQWTLAPAAAGDPSVLVLRDGATQADLAVVRYDRSALSWVWGPIAAAAQPVP